MSRRPLRAWTFVAVRSHDDRYSPRQAHRSSGAGGYRVAADVRRRQQQPAEHAPRRQRAGAAARTRRVAARRRAGAARSRRARRRAAARQRTRRLVRPRAAAPPAVPVAATTPTPSPAAAASVLAHATAASAMRPPEHGSARASSGAPVRRSSRAPRPRSSSSTRRASSTQTQTHIPTRWMEGFYPIYATAQRTFGVNWLLIASIHRQESAFSTAPGTYRGLNFAGCCGGPMQFNVTNGPVTTWRLVSDSYRYGRRPAAYDHATAKHPSIYDDFDSIMAAAHLLSADGAGYALDGVGVGGGVRLLRPRRDRRDVRRPGARARDRLVPARLLHQLRRRRGARRSRARGVWRAVQRAGRSVSGSGQVTAILALPSRPPLLDTTCDRSGRHGRYMAGRPGRLLS